MNSKRCLVIISLIFILIGMAKTNVRLSPTLLFINEPRRSTSFEVLNVTDREVEVWIEIKYGYVTTDDTDNIFINAPEKLEIDDQPLDKWTSLYPNKFLLAPSEKRYVRVIVAPPLALNDNEYWARIFVNSKPSKTKPNLTPQKQGQSQVGLAVVNQQSIPVHYRKGKVSTSVDIVETPDIKISNKEILFKAKYQRSGNSSYWGMMHFEIVDTKGKVLKKYDKNLVVYKRITLSYNIDINGIPPGNYSLKAAAETRRMDDATKYVIKSEPKTWKYNITIE